MDYRVIKADSKTLKKKAFDIREEVFVVEQQVPIPEEFDEFEKKSRHFVALDKNDQPIGAARWRWTAKGIKLERFVVKRNLRGGGLGSALLKATLDDIATHTKTGTYLYIHSQLEAVSLYEKHGFQKKGEQFEECGIIHYLMWRVT